MMAHPHFNKRNFKGISLQRSKANAGLNTSADLEQTSRKLREAIEAAVLGGVVVA